MALCVLLKATKRTAIGWTCEINSQRHPILNAKRVPVRKTRQTQMNQTPPAMLNHASLTEAVHFLAGIDADLAGIVAAHGHPPLWARTPGFPTLIHIILEQQVSLASAQAAFNKLAAAGQVTPQRFLKFSDEELRGFGFSRQKARYGRELSRAIESGDLDIDGLAALDDDNVRTQLMRVKGIGRWTADIYLLMALLRPDVWPTGDLALVKAMQKVKGMPAAPTADEASDVAASWRPWRAVAARILWHYYLSTR